MTKLCDMKCKACRGDVPPLKGKDLAPYLDQLQDDWEVVDEHHLKRTYTFGNFAEALAFVNRVGEVAEQEQHHPWIHFTWGKVVIELYTHKIGGLAESDFVLAAKLDALDS